jgi:hypothetical protein
MFHALISVHPLKTYMIDYIVEPIERTARNKSKFLYYLIAINTLSRFIYVELANTRALNATIGSDGRIEDVVEQIDEMGMNSASLFLSAMKSIYQQAQEVTGDAKPILYLWGDGQKSFNATRGGVREWYKSHGITFTEFPRQRTFDPSLTEPKALPVFKAEGIMNRAIRTLRDLAFKADGRGVLYPELLYQIVTEYNTRQTRAFYRLVRFPLTPLIVEKDPELQLELLRRERGANSYTLSAPGYQLAIGTVVRVRNPRDPKIKHRAQYIPGDFEVIGYHNGLFHVQSNGIELWKPRTDLAVVSVPSRKWQ